jgi:hypothetical protein
VPEHIFLNPEKFSENKPYEYPGPKPQKPLVPARDRTSHTAELREQVKTIKKEMAAAIALQEEKKSKLDRGLIVEFESFEGIEKAFEGSSFGRNIELLNTRYENKKTYATVFIPNGSLQYFEKKINVYYEEPKRLNDKAKDHQRLIDTIASFRKATVKALWTDTVPMPNIDTDIFCWEVWLSVRDNRQQQLMGFKEIAKSLNIETSETSFEFKERTVLLARATTKQLEQSIVLLNNIAELRKAKTAASFFTGMDGKEQKEWLDDLQKRIVFEGETNRTPFICILDTGVNAEHPLLNNALGADDLHTINDAWGKADMVGHGTEMAGLALYGDLTEILETGEQIEIYHRLESSKIINASVFVPDDTRRPLELYADFTKQGVAQTEISRPKRNRIFQMAVTTIDSQDKGKPSSWSAALDMLAVDMDDEKNKRLFLVATGNAAIEETKKEYPIYNLLEEIRDPGQAWNVLTIGAYTEKDILSDDENIENSRPTASHGQISPYTTTSYNWKTDWPLKPDIVMEGGNTAENKYGKVSAHSLSLITTNYQFLEKPFAPIWATSAASALASKMCVQIMNKYPTLTPETVRALMVHSASWTPAMLRQFNCDRPGMNKGDYHRLVRICGFGVPNLTRALTSMKNDFTMVIEDTLQPYKIENGSSSPKNNEIKFYSLPFPNDELVKLGETDVEMRVTLSYFIEPNPSSRVHSVPSYRSHGLRFDVIHPYESEDFFKGRLTKSMREDNIDYSNDIEDQWWKVGANNRTKGSIHSDIWKGSAVELSRCNILAVYPVNGWWKKSKKHEKTNNIANYSLLISIRTSVDVDLMTSVELKIASVTKTDISV